jgi:hypothetical protein
VVDVHRTYRWLDSPPRLLGFSFAQWVALVVAIAGGYGLAKVLGLPFKLAASGGVFVIGLPATLAYLSEGDGLPVGRVVLDGLRWSWERLLERLRGGAGGVGGAVGVGGAEAPGEAAVTKRLGVLEVGEDGVLVREDGFYVRYLEVQPVNPLVRSEQACEQVADALGGVIGRLHAGQGLQLYVDARPVAVEELVARERAEVERAAAGVQAEEREGTGGGGIDGDGTGGAPAATVGVAEAMRSLGAAVEDSLRTHCEGVAAMAMRYVVVVPWRPGKLPRRRAGVVRLGAEEHERALRDSGRHAEGLRRDLEAMRLAVRALGGEEVRELLHARVAGAEKAWRQRRNETMGVEEVRKWALPVAGTWRRRHGATGGTDSGLDFSARGHVRVGDGVERVSYLAGVPEHTWLGWLMHLMQSPLPYSLSVHVTATDRLRERQAQRRRWKRLRGVNLGTAMRGRPVDPAAVEQEQEAEELARDLAVSAGAAIYRVGVYLRLAEPEGDVEALAEQAGAVAREAMLVSDARLDGGVFAQRRLWEASLPLGRDAAGRTRRYLTRNVGDSWPLASASCGSPEGLALGYAQPGRTLERLDPFDPEHENHMLIVSGRSGAGKTMTVNVLLIRALARGLRVAVIDRAGHYQFLTSLIPGAVQVRLGGKGNREAVCPWDVPDPARVEQGKVDFLLALHGLLLGRRDGSGLGDLEENLLGLAIREVYARCALTGEQARELILQEELYKREASELRAGASDVAAVLRNLALRLNNYVGEGPYAYLADWPTTVGADARILSFDTRAIPDSRAGAALFAIVEHVTARIERMRDEALAGDLARGWEGRHALVIDEAWKLVEQESTGRWFNELSRRSRHLALWLIAISHSLSDFENEYGQALLRNASMRLLLEQDVGALA